MCVYEYGLLSTDQAFGDAEFKKIMKVDSGDDGEEEYGVTAPLVLPTPEFRSLVLEKEDEFVLLACDGVFDVFSCQESIDHLRSLLVPSEGPASNAQQACVSLVHESVHTRGSRDNVTAIVVVLKPSLLPRTK